MALHRPNPEYQNYQMPATHSINGISDAVQYQVDLIKLEETLQLIIDPITYLQEIGINQYESKDIIDSIGFYRANAKRALELVKKLKQHSK